MHWDWFIYHFHLLLPAGTSAASCSGGKSIQPWAVECRATQCVSKPCSLGGQEPTGTADTVGVANWKAGMVSSPRRCTDSIFTGQPPVSGVLRRTCHTPQLPAAGKNPGVGNDRASLELTNLWAQLNPKKIQASPFSINNYLSACCLSWNRTSDCHKVSQARGECRP